MKSLILTGILLISVIHAAKAIECYVCDTSDPTNPFQCGEHFERYDEPDIKPHNCSNVHNARYCIKHVGRFGANAINCYQCSSTENINCADIMINQPDSDLKPESCNHVIDAKFCIKTTALYGGIGAKRFCSSKDLGNYCNYVQNVGDQREYRSCIFTCSTDGCNSGMNVIISKTILLVTGFLTFLKYQL